MKQLNLLFTGVILLLLFMISCSDDDAPVAIPVPDIPQPSRIVDKIEIYKGTDKQINFTSTMSFLYDNASQLIQVNTDDPLSEVNYIRGEKFSYSFASGNSPLVKVVADVKDGKAIACSFSNKEGEAVYSYVDGFLDTSYGNGLRLTYTWSDGNLIEVKSSNRLYDNLFDVSSVTNDYNIDLNVLPQLIDERAEYTNVMNTFGQLGGILGNRSKNILEDTHYNYDYSYDSNGRLKELSLKKILVSDDEVNTFSFRIKYKE